MDVRLQGVRVEEIGAFCYLGSMTRKESLANRDVKNRIAFAEQRQLLTSTYIRKARIMYMYIVALTEA